MSDITSYNRNKKSIQTAYELQQSRELSYRIKRSDSLKAEYIKALWSTDTALDSADMGRAIEVDKYLRLITIEVCVKSGETYAKMSHRLPFGIHRDLNVWVKTDIK
jgi:hypothetical protein